MAKLPEFRSPSANTKLDSGIRTVIRQTEALWRRAHLTYDQTRLVSRRVRARLAIARPTQRKRVVDRLSAQEAEQFIRAAYRAPAARGLMLKTLLQTGARVSEFVAIRVEDVFHDECAIMIRKGKGGTQRSVPILPELAQELRTHLAGRREGYLFETRSATSFTPRRVQQIVKEVAASAGISKRVHCHLLRHTIAQQLLEGGMPLEGVQRFLGHERVTTTQVYAESTPALIADAYRRALRSNK